VQIIIFLQYKDLQEICSGFYLKDKKELIWTKMEFLMKAFWEKIKKEKLNDFTMSLIKSSLRNWLQGFSCKNTIKLFLHTSCFINTVFSLLCL